MSSRNLAAVARVRPTFNQESRALLRLASPIILSQIAEASSRASR